MVKRIFAKRIVQIELTALICLALFCRELTALAVVVEHESDDYIDFFTPVLSGPTMVSADGDAPGEITLRGMVSYFTVTPVNSGVHPFFSSYGTYNFLLSKTDRNFLKTLMDPVNKQNYVGNTVVFPFDTWQDATGNGMSRDDFFYAAGTEIPIGTARTFYVTPATKVGNYKIGCAALAVNSPSEHALAFSNGVSVPYNTSLVGNKVNREGQYAAYNEAGCVVKSGLIGADIVAANGFFEDSLPRKEVVLKKGYAISVCVSSVGEYSDSGKVELVPNFSWVDEGFGNEVSGVKLFYPKTEEGKKQLIEVGSAKDTARVKNFVASEERLGIDADTYNLKSALDTLSAGAVVGQSSYGKTIATTCFYRAVDSKILPPNGGKAADFAKEIEKGSQSWYLLYNLPTDICLVKPDSKYYSMSDDARLADYIYGLNGFVEEGFLKVTFDVVARDDVGGVSRLSAGENGVVLYYDLDKKIGDDLVIRGIYNY